jgi:hypothetical protein
VPLLAASAHKESVMSMRTLMFFAAVGFAAALPNAAGAAYVEVEAAPPPPQQEAVPEQRAGFIWVPGYWGWSGSQHVWVNGQYVPARLHHHWVTARWEQRGPKWYFEDGRWEADDDSTTRE